MTLCFSTSALAKAATEQVLWAQLFQVGIPPPHILAPAPYREKWHYMTQMSAFVSRRQSAKAPALRVVGLTLLQENTGNKKYQQYNVPSRLSITSIRSDSCLLVFITCLCNTCFKHYKLQTDVKQKKIKKTQGCRRVDKKVKPCSTFAARQCNVVR